MPGKQHLTMAAFSRLAHCSRAAITKARADLRVHLDADGRVPVDHQVNREFLAAQRARQKKEEPRKPPRGSKTPKKSAAKPAAAYRRAARGEALPLIIQKLEQEIRFKKRGADLRELELAEKRRQLLPREIVRKWFSILSADLRAHMLTLPRRAIPHLLGLLESGKEDEALDYLQREISDATLRVLKGVDDGARAHFKSLTSAE